MQTVGELAQLQRENFERHTNAEYELWVTASKSIAVLNSGAVVAMLGFFQALIGKPEAIAAFKMYGIGALVAYLLGSMLAITTLFARRSFLFAMSRDMTVPAQEAHDMAARVLTLAFGAFFAGSVSVVIGLVRAL